MMKSVSSSFSTLTSQAGHRELVISRISVVPSPFVSITTPHHAHLTTTMPQSTYQNQKSGRGRNAESFSMVPKAVVRGNRTSQSSKDQRLTNFILIGTST